MLHPIAEAERRVTAAACGLGTGGTTTCGVSAALQHVVRRNALKSRRYFLTGERDEPPVIHFGPEITVTKALEPVSRNAPIQRT